MGLLNTDFEDADSKILYGILIGIWIRGAWEIYLLLRQWKVINNTTTVPNILANILPLEIFFLGRYYYLELLVYLMVYTFLDIVAKSVVLFFDLISIFWTLGIGVARAIEIQPTETVISIFFAMIIHTVLTLYQIIFKMYFQFALENHYNLNKMTLPSFLMTSIVYYLLKMIGTLVYVSAILYAVRLTGQYFFLSLWLLRLISVLIVNLIFSNILLKTMRQFKPLENGELKNSIQEIAARVNFPLTQVYVYKASETSTEKNAFYYGFYRGKRIVIYDTLIDFLSIEEIVGVVAHELGHWKGSHTVKLRLLVEIYYTSILTAAYFLFPLDIIYRAFNFRDSKPTIIGLIIIFDFIFIPWYYVFSSISTIFTRYFEYKADAFAVKLGQGRYLRSALIKLDKYSADFPVNDWLFSTFHYNHPTLLERLDKLPEE